MQVEFVGQSNRDSSQPQSSTGRLLNMYRESIGGRSPWTLRSVLGQTEFADLDGTNSYAMHGNRSWLLVSHNGALWRVNEARETALIGSPLPEDVNTRITNVYSATSGNIAAMTAQGRYFVWDRKTDTYSEPSGGAFRTFGDVCFFGQRVVLSEKSGRRLQWSGLSDPLTLDALDFATASQYEDDILRLIPVSGALWVFKERSIERWYTADDGPRYINGSVTGVGLKAWGLVAQFPDGVFWIGNDNKARVAFGASESIVSTEAVNTAIALGEPLRCTYYRDEGHEIVCLHFGDRPSWCFDMTTQEWHERAEGDDFGPWDCRAMAEAPWGGFFTVSREGSVARFDRTNRDRADHFPRRAIGRTFENEGNPFRVRRIEMRANVGEFTSAPDVMLRASKDKGRTWGDWKSRNTGAAGKHQTRLEWRALGQFRNFTPEIALWGVEDLAIEAVAYVDIV